MSELNNKVDALASQIASIKSKTAATTRVMVIVYCIFVVFVFAYTTFIMSRINELVTPEGVSTYLRVTLEDQIPDIRKELVKTSKENAPELASYLVSSSQAMIPGVEDKLKEIIDMQVEDLIASLKSDVKPEMVKVIHDNAKEINLTAKTLKDQTAANDLARALVGELDREMGKMIGRGFSRRINILRKDLDFIARRPLSELTMKEATERKVIMSWVFLMEHGVSGENLFGEVLEQAAISYNNLWGITPE